MKFICKFRTFRTDGYYYLVYKDGDKLVIDKGTDGVIVNRKSIDAEVVDRLMQVAYLTHSRW